jgi:carbamoyltransferase
MRELEDEGKVMALADYASPVPDDRNPLLSFVHVHDGVLECSHSGPALRRALASVHWRFPNEQFAFMAQRLVERTCLALARDAVRLTGCRQLALAGGVVSNVKATRRVRLHSDIEDVYVFPHMGDGGLAVGAAAWAAASSDQSVSLQLHDLALGPRFGVDEIRTALVPFGSAVLPSRDLPRCVAAHLERGDVVMWFQGGMEYGPRALGHRSVLARPDRLDVRDRLNLALKRRVWYQPFCPSMLESEATRVLADCTSTRNHAMTMAFEVKPEMRPFLSGVTSVDGTCRPQFVPDRQDSPFAALLHEASRRWNVGCVLNTSFNIHGEPLVCTPAEAVDVFRRSGADALAIGPFLVTRSELSDRARADA